MSEQSGKEKPDWLKKLIEIVRGYSPEGFIIFYHFMSNNTMPLHCVDWIVDFFRAQHLGLGFANKAFRFSLKTTIFTDYFTAYFMGCQPRRTNLFVQANDEKAAINSKFVADLIEHSVNWKIFFPEIVPDKSKGWGVQGYFIKRNDIDYGEWRRGIDSDPTLLGAGYKSSDILGLHPTGLLIVDDIHDFNNTRSPRELNTVIEKWESEIKPARVKDTIELYNYTPWVPGDIGAKIEQSPYYIHSTTTICEDGDIEKPIWPENYGPRELERLRADHTESEWARMFLCDLEAMKGRVLKREWLHWYPHEDIKPDWQVVFGVDYASVANIQETRGRDYFAIAVLKIVPNGGLILIDGVKKYVTQGMAEDAVVSWCERYEPFRVGVETLGKGEEFYYSLLRLAKVPVRKSTVANRSKPVRIEKGLGPLFRNGRVWLSDVPNNKFINDFVEEWISWDGLETFSDDCLDATWHAIKMAKANLLEIEEDEMPRGRRKKKEYSHPLMAFRAV